VNGLSLFSGIDGLEVVLDPNRMATAGQTYKITNEGTD
jgi:hypothetical protein